jgi:hypothetical protein
MHPCRHQNSGLRDNNAAGSKWVPYLVDMFNCRLFDDRMLDQLWTGQDTCPTEVQARMSPRTELVSFGWARTPEATGRQDDFTKV